MATKKAAGSTRLGRDSNAQRLGIKLHDGQAAKSGSILARQRGTKWHPGKNVKRAKDDTLFSVANGVVKFTRKQLRKYDGSLKKATIINVVPQK